MIIDGIEFPNVWCAPGARNFTGRGWWYTDLLKVLFPSYGWDNTGFVTKTATLLPRPGNMPLAEDGETPKERLPKCIKVYPFSGHVLNAVGLSGPGLDEVLAMLRKNPPRQPFMLSIMCVGEDHLAELQNMLEKIAEFKQTFDVPFMVQVNMGCPNTGEDPTRFYAELDAYLDEFRRHDMKAFFNFSPLVPVEMLLKADRHPACAGFWLGNSILWGTPGIEWKRFSSLGRRLARKRPDSPLPRRLGWSASSDTPRPKGGLSGPACRKFTLSTINDARRAGVQKPIIGGNGFQKKESLDYLWLAGADGVALGIVAMLRPWRLGKLINYANEKFVPDD
jgi:dihydroorotate dehydrogenase